MASPMQEKVDMTHKELYERIEIKVNARVENIIEDIKRYYKVESEYDLEAGCYHNDRWLSLGKIIELIEDAD